MQAGFPAVDCCIRLHEFSHAAPHAKLIDKNTLTNKHPKRTLQANFSLLNLKSFLAVFFFLIPSHFYSLWAHFSLQCKVLHFYGNRTTMRRSRKNSKISAAQQGHDAINYILKKTPKIIVQHFSKLPQVLPILKTELVFCLSIGIFHIFFFFYRVC